jgi:hypothetical protein
MGAFISCVKRMYLNKNTYCIYTLIHQPDIIFEITNIDYILFISTS